MLAYLGYKITEDNSLEVSTPEGAQEFVRSVRKGVVEITEAALKLLSEEYSEPEDEMEEDCSAEGTGLLQEIQRGSEAFARTTDEEIIAEAAVLYKDTENGKNAFESLKMVVNYVLSPKPTDA